MRRRATVAFAAGAAVLGTATAGMLTGTEPFATWYYLFAWGSMLVVMDAAVARRGGAFFLLGRPAFLASLTAWSVPFWLFFELVNFRIENWYYVFVPADRAGRWAGITLSFATVLPAIFVAERLLQAWGVGRGVGPGPSRPLVRVDERTRLALQALGGAMLILPLLWPRVFFPLVWGGVTLIADPFVHHHDPARSLLGDLERGRTGRILRLLVGGMGIGLLWELFNMGARGKWIYTIPGLGELKLFEMPLPGFLGFPVFALEGFATYQALALAGLAVRGEKPANGKLVPASGSARAAAAAGAALFSLLVLLGMERGTISSYTPRLDELAVPAAELRRAGYDVFSLAAAAPSDVADATGADTASARRWSGSARLAVLRGIGTANAARLRSIGVGAIEELAASDPQGLVRQLRSGGAGTRVHPARIRIWVRSAQEAATPGP